MNFTYVTLHLSLFWPHLLLPFSIFFFKWNSPSIEKDPFPSSHPTHTDIYFWVGVWEETYVFSWAWLISFNRMIYGVAIHFPMNSDFMDGPCSHVDLLFLFIEMYRKRYLAFVFYSQFSFFIWSFLLIMPSNLSFDRLFHFQNFCLTLFHNPHFLVELGSHHIELFLHAADYLVVLASILACVLTSLYHFTHQLVSAH